MNTVEIVLLCILGAFCMLVAYMILKTVFCRPPKKVLTDFTPVEVDKNEVAHKLSEAVSIPTVSVKDNVGDFGKFDEYEAFLERSYPLIHSYAKKTVINGHSLVFEIEGTANNLLPACFLSHIDVVPARAEEWSMDPFSGEIKDGYVYGRGSLDMKGHMIILLEGVERLLSAKKLPKRTIYLCFGHDEEITGVNGARKIVEYFMETGVRMEYVVDEGGIIMDGSMLGIPQRIAAIGTSEKGYVDFELTAVKNGGHASSPKKRSSVDAIGEAVYLLSHLPMKAYWSEPLKETFKTVAPYMKFPYRFLFVNRAILSPLLKVILCKINPVTNSLLRTTFAFTQLFGADAPNIIPNTAKAVVNVRINMGQTSEEVKKYIEKVVGKDIKVTVHGMAFEPVVSGNTDSIIYKEMTKAIEEVFGYVSTPYPFIAASDAKYYNKISENVFRFGPIDIEQEDQDRIHSKDERCKVDSLASGTQFFYRFIENTCY